MSAIKGWKRVALAYVVALAVSHLMMWILHSPVIQQEETSDQEVRLNVFDGDQTLADEHITIGYDDIYEGSEENPPVLLLLPGGPEGPEVFDEVIPELATHYRLLIPHLPGYEGKNKDLPSYSFNSSARYSQQFLERLDIPEANVVGFGLGGASAIHLAHDNPDQVSSLTLIGSIGVQELQLLGSYRLNHAVHGMQLAGVWLFYNAIPHFGLFEAFEIDVSYAKRHYESDQRPLRDYLEQYNKPMLILHGKDDPLVPLAAAQEHNRIVPHSVLKLYNGNHDLLQSHTDSVSADIHQFISEVQNGTAQTRDTASEERIAESRKSFSNVDFAKFEGVSLLIIMLIIILGTLVSEDLTAIGAGLLAARGLIGFWPATLACFLGIFIGDVGLYVAGRFLGRPALKKAPFKWIINEEDLQKSSKWFKAKGPTIIVATRFLPGSRLPTYFSAGVMQVGFWMFLFYFILSGIIWAPLLVGVTQLLGNELLYYFTLYQGYAIWVLAGGLALIFITVKLIIPAFSYKGRRLLVSRYYKLSRWQHWWPVFKYLPVALYILYLGIKNRSLTLFTATNPGIADGGLAGESKSKMLDLLEDSSQVAAYQKITYHTDFREMLHIADRFIREHQLSYPVV
ncbi:MAG: alpha/beta fold hydrolase, partial [Bacteroidota bacterium]